MSSQEPSELIYQLYYLSHLNIYICAFLSANIICVKHLQFSVIKGITCYMTFLWGYFFQLKLWHLYLHQITRTGDNHCSEVLREAVWKIAKKTDIMWWPNEHFDISYWLTLETAEKKPKTWLHCALSSMSWRMMQSKCRPSFENQFWPFKGKHVFLHSLI